MPCTAERPVCDVAGTCQECSQDGDCDNFEGTPYCVGGGCVGCGEPGAGSEFCLERGPPVCQENGSCRSCRENAECASGACYRGCLDEDEVLYVDLAGNPDGACSHDDLCATIARAVLRAEELGLATIVLAPGTYPESVSFTGGGSLSEPPLLLFSDGDATIAPPAAGAPAVRLRDGHMVLERITLTGATGATGHGIDCKVTGGSLHASLVLRDVEVVDSGGAGILVDTCDLRVEDLRVTGNGGDGIRFTGTLLQVLTTRIEDCGGVGLRAEVPEGMGAIAIQSWITGNQGGGIDWTGPFGFLESLVVTDNGSAASSTVGGILIDAGDDAGSLRPLRGLTVARNAVSVDDRAAGVHCLVPLSLDHSILWQNEGGLGAVSASCATNYALVAPGLVPDGDGNIAGDPSFVAPDDGDYHLRGDSDAIDRGDPEVTFELGDIDVDFRVVGPAADLGADEYTPP